jgi:hypothetical protein
MDKMKDLNIEQILGAMEKPQTATTFEKITEALSKVDGVLAQLQNTVDHLDKLGLKPLFVRGCGKYLGVDAETPLKLDNQPKQNFVSKTHELFIAQINKLTEDELQKQIGVGQNVQATET